MIEQLHHTELDDVLDHFYVVPEKPSLFLKGTFGIGKTAAMRAFAIRKAKELKLEYSEDFRDINDESKFLLLVFVVHQYDEAEFKGLPFPNEDRTGTVYLPLGLMPNKGQGLIFLDEINLARRGVQNNCFQLVEDRKLGFYVVPEGYMVTAAGNKDSDRSNIQDTPMPLNDRFFHAELTIPPVHDLEEGGVTIKGWVNGYAVNNGVDNRVSFYLMYQPQDIYTYDPDSPVIEPALGTPRSWKKVSDVIKGIPTSNIKLIRRLTAMKVGTALADKFCAWLIMSKKYDIQAIFNGQDFTAPKEVDVLYSLTSAFVTYYLEKKDEKTAAKFAELTFCFRKEHQIMLFDQAKSGDKMYFKKLKATDLKLYNKLAEELFGVLAAMSSE
jgi:hypothetical protein